MHVIVDRKHKISVLCLLLDTKKNTNMTELEPKLSFIVPARLSTKYLISTIRNLLDSFDMRYEVVLSLNNGTTPVPKAIRNIRDNRLRIFTPKSNLSMAKNWFNGLANSSGEWICFVGSDDGVVSSNISKFIDIAEEQVDLDVITNHNIAFTYSSFDKVAWANLPINAPSGLRAEVGWPTRLASLFPQFTYDMPQPYSKALVRRKIFEPLLERESEIPGCSPDIYLGNYVAIASKKGLYVDEILTIRGTSSISIGSQIFSNRKLSRSAKEIMDDFNSKSFLYPLQSIFGVTCRPAISMDYYNLVKNNESLLNRKINVAWCQLSCLDSIHHPKMRFAKSITNIIYKIGLAFRKIWFWKNFRFNVARDHKTIMPNDTDMFKLSRILSDPKWLIEIAGKTGSK